jgi:hypothetical protein
MQELLKKYREHAIEHGEQTVAGNSVATNKAHDQLLKTLKSLCEADADSEILSLLEDENASVRLWAGAHSLEVDEAKALAALNKLATAGVPIVSMSARYTVQGWQNGELRVRQSL